MTSIDDAVAARPSRRGVLGATAGLVAAGVLGVSAVSTQAVATETTPKKAKGQPMGTITTKDGAEIFYKDWGDGPVVMFSHGWPLNADAWDDQLLLLSQNGFRAIAHDRRGHGRSSQVWGGNDIDHYADDMRDLVLALDLKDVVHVGHSTGAGEVVRYLGRHGTDRVRKVLLASAIPPLMLQTPANPGGVPLAVFDGIRAGLASDRSQFYRDLSAPFFGANRPGAVVTDGARESFWQQCMTTGLKAAYDGVKAQSETDFTADLGRIDVPTLVIHGSDDQLVPVDNHPHLIAKLVKGATVSIYDGAPHGFPVTHRERFNADLLDFVRA